MTLEQRTPSARGLVLARGCTRLAASLQERRRRRRRAGDLDQQSLVLLASWFIEREPIPNVLLDGHLRLVLRNACAAPFLRAVTEIDDRTHALRFLDRSHQRELVRVQNEEADRARFQANIDGVLEEVQVTAIRVGGSGTLFLRVTASTPILSIVQRIKNELKLTHAEAEVALAISRGYSLQQIADARSASINTVKTQVRYVYQKTGVCSQVELTRRVAESM